MDGVVIVLMNRARYWYAVGYLSGFASYLNLKQGDYRPYWKDYDADKIDKPSFIYDASDGFYQGRTAAEHGKI